MAFSKLLFLCHKQRVKLCTELKKASLEKEKLYLPKENKDTAANAVTRPDMCVLMFLGSFKKKAIFGDANSRLQCQNKSSTTAKEVHNVN